MANDELHWVSRSMTSTRFLPRMASACASIIVTVDLPTPPWRLPTQTRVAIVDLLAVCGHIRRSTRDSHCLARQCGPFQPLFSSPQRADAARTGWECNRGARGGVSSLERGVGSRE